MAKKEDYSYLPPALRPADEATKAKQRYQRQQVRSSRRQQEARKREKARSRIENIKQAVKDVRESDAFQVGAMAIGRGRGGAAKPPKFKPKKLSGNVKFLGARKSSTRPSGRSTPSTRKLYKEKAKADAVSGYGSVTTPAGKEAQAASSKLSAKIAERKKGRTFKVKKKDEAPAKGKRTKMTRKHPGKAPSMGLKSRTQKSYIPSKGSRATKTLRPMKKGEVATKARYAQSHLKEMKSRAGKYDRELKVYNKHSRQGRDDLRGSRIRQARKKLLAAKKAVATADKAGTVYQRGYKFSGPKKVKGTKPTQAKPKAKGAPHRGEKAPGGAHLGGPKVKVPKGAKTKKKTEPSKAAPKISKSDMKNRIGPVMPGSAHFGKLSPKEFAAYRASLEGKSSAMIRKSMKSKPGLTKAQKAILLGAAAAGAVGKAKRNAVKDRARSVMMAKKKALSKSLPKEVKATKIDSTPAKPIKKRRRKETAAQKNKRLNIRFRSAGQRQAERYPSKEK